MIRRCAGSLLRLGRLARLHDAQLDHAVDEVGRTLRWQRGPWANGSRRGLRRLAVRARGAAPEIARRAPGIPGVQFAGGARLHSRDPHDDDPCDVFTIADEMLSGVVRPTPDGGMPGAGEPALTSLCGDRRVRWMSSWRRWPKRRSGSCGRARFGGTRAHCRGLWRSIRDPSDNDFDGHRTGMPADGDGRLSCPSGWRRSTPCSTWRRRGLRRYRPRLPRPPVATHGTNEGPGGNR